MPGECSGQQLLPRAGLDSSPAARPHRPRPASTSNNKRLLTNKLLVITALVLTTAAPALAHAESGAGNPSGPYIGGGRGRFNLHIRNPYWSLEATYIDFGGPVDRFQVSGSDGPIASR